MTYCIFLHGINFFRSLPIGVLWINLKDSLNTVEATRLVISRFQDLDIIDQTFILTLAYFAKKLGHTESPQKSILRLKSQALFNEGTILTEIFHQMCP